MSYGNPGHERAPRTGTIRKIKVIAGGPGSFRLQIAKVKVNTIGTDNTAEVVRNGPVIHYQGQSQQNWNSDHYNVESFDVNVAVEKGQYLAMRSKYSSALRCSSGGDNQLVASRRSSPAGASRTPPPPTDAGCCCRRSSSSPPPDHRDCQRGPLPRGPLGGDGDRVAAPLDDPRGDGVGVGGRAIDQPRLDRQLADVEPVELVGVEAADPAVAEDH